VKDPPERLNAAFSAAPATNILFDLGLVVAICQSIGGLEIRVLFAGPILRSAMPLAAPQGCGWRRTARAIEFRTSSLEPRGRWQLWVSMLIITNG
jgi:hypothetical protein